MTNSTDSLERCLNSDLQEFTDQIMEAKNFSAMDDDVFYEVSMLEDSKRKMLSAHLQGFGHEEQIRLHNHLIAIYRWGCSSEVSLFNLILEEYPSMISLLSVIISVPSLLLVVVKPVISILLIITYKALVETGDFNDKQKIVNRCIELLFESLRIRDTNTGVYDDSMTSIVFDLIKNTKYQQFMYLLQHMTVEKQLELSLQKNIPLGPHIEHIRLCLSLFKLNMLEENHLETIKNYFQSFINRCDWTDPVLSSLTKELLDADSHFLISSHEKCTILMGNSDYLINSMVELLMSIIRNPFKLIDEKGKLVEECINRRPYVALIFGNVLKSIHLETGNFRILMLTRAFFKDQTNSDTLFVPREELHERITQLHGDIKLDWIKHQYHYYDWFLISLNYVVLRLATQKQSAIGEETFEICLSYVTHYLFGGDTSKDLTLCKTSLINVLTQLTTCQDLTSEQLENFSSTEDYQNFSIYSLTNIYLNVILVRHGSKYFTFDNMIDLFLNSGRDLEERIEIIIIILNWMELIISMLSSKPDSLSTQYLILLSYLNVMGTLKHENTKDRTFPNLLSRFNHLYYGTLINNQRTNNHTESHSTNHPLLPVILSTFDNLQ